MQTDKDAEGKELVSMKTLAHMIDTPVKTIRHWVWKRYRNIPYVKLGHQIRFPLPQIRYWYMGGAAEEEQAKSARISKKQ